MKRLLPALAGVSLLLSACGSGAGTSTPTSSRELLSFSTASLGSAYVGEAFTSTVAPVGGTGPYSVRLASGALPAGLKFTGGSSAVLAGTPTATGSSSFSLEVSDANLSVKTQSFTLAVTDLPPLDFTLSLPTGEVRGETRLPLSVQGPRGVRAARYTWVMPEGAVVTKIQSENSTDAGRPVVFWKQNGRNLLLDFGFRLAPKNGAQVALISVRPMTDKPLSLAAASGTTTFLLAQDGAGKVLREVKPPEPKAPEVKPADTKPTDAKPTDAKPTDTKPADPKVDPKAAPAGAPVTPPFSTTPTTDPTKTDPTKAAPTTTDPAKTDTPKPDPITPAAPKTDPVPAVPGGK
ncbi:putative Ig domain-containing protein [Deinococcus sp.]|uniref:Ig domain-containing protein n=1 Tax=Deinococcus sp. TaxID=47478 RepID=UPI0025D707D1|nr:putative Ig domain-containing protein [Deinococcus sp.]